jgi:hypothetical protein
LKETRSRQKPKKAEFEVGLLKFKLNFEGAQTPSIRKR